MFDYATEEKIEKTLTRLAKLMKQGDNRLWVDDSNNLYLCRPDGDKLLVVDHWNMAIDGGEADIVESNGIMYVEINCGDHRRHR